MSSYTSWPEAEQDIRKAFSELVGPKYQTFPEPILSGIIEYAEQVYYSTGTKKESSRGFILRLTEHTGIGGTFWGELDITAENLDQVDKVVDIMRSI